MVGVMNPKAPQEIRVVKNQTSFVLAGWLFALVVLAGAIGGGTWVWRRAKAAGESLRAKVVETKSARQRPVPVSPVPVPEAEQPVAPSTPEPARSAREVNLDTIGRIGLGPRRATSPSTTREGAVSRAEVQRVVRSHQGELAACYEAGRQFNPNLFGRVTVRFVIGARGQVSSATMLSSSLGNNRTETCLLQAIRQWEFPAPKNGADVSIVYPFVFKPAQE